MSSSNSAANGLIHVFLPKPERDGDEFYQDGWQQHQGFQLARATTGMESGMRGVTYYFMEKDDDGEKLKDKMVAAYETGATYFIMTMSSKIQKIRTHFRDWRKKCQDEKKHRVPVLIATVTSAPDIANVSEGIVRWYIRSKEESTELAKYLAWSVGAKEGVVFFVTHTEGLDDSDYGNDSKDTFINQYRELVPDSRIEAISVTSKSAKRCVDCWFESRSGSNAKKTMIYVVGYCAVLKETLNAIVTNLKKLDLSREDLQRAFAVACTSTLTCGSDSQPDDESLDDLVVTVKPRLQKGGTFARNDRNVVFLSARECLRRVLKLTKESADSSNFLELWRDGNKEVGLANYWRHLDQEFLSNGDTIINVDIADSHYWRVIDPAPTISAGPAVVTGVRPESYPSSAGQSSPNTVMPPCLTFPGYTVMSLLGSGATGTVYHAIHASLSRAVALKALHPHLVSGELLARFRREVAALKALNHAHIVKIYDDHLEGASPFFTMEYLEDGDLGKRLETGALPIAESARIVCGLARGIQSVHDKNMLHRDLKPANVGIGNGGVAKLTDFGLVKIHEDISLTKFGIALGTPIYMAPEQAVGNAENASDIYGLGAILYHCLTGKPPFDPKQPYTEWLARVSIEEPTAPRELNKNVPYDLEVTCLTCLSKDPLARYSKAIDLATALTRFYDPAAAGAAYA